MRYKIILKLTTHKFSVTCACGECNPEVIIDESAKEDFKEMMNWDELDWRSRTVLILDEKSCPCGHIHQPSSDGNGLRTYCVEGSQCNSDKCEEFVKHSVKETGGGN